MPRTAKTAVAPAPMTRRAASVRAIAEPLYRQLVQTLRDEIVRGTFPVGSQLPTEEELCERFDVSRHTVREALRQLRTDGLVASRQGFGTTVMPPPPSSAFNVHKVASIDELIAYAAASHYEIDQTDMVQGDSVSDFELPAGSRWLRLQGFRRTESPPAPPVCWTEVYVASAFAGVERLVHRQRGPVWQLIEDTYGERLVEVEQTMRVRAVPAELAGGLDVDPASSVVEVCRIYKNTSGKTAEVSVNLYPADKFRFSMKLSRA